MKLFTDMQPREERLATRRAWYKRTKLIRREKLREYSRRTCRKYRDDRLVKNKRWCAKNPEKVRLHSLKKRLKKFKITPADYSKLLSKQNGGCAICGGSPTNGTRLSVDHCHITGIVRGLLCSTCNFGIGKFRDSIELLSLAIQYLQKSKSSPPFSNQMTLELPEEAGDEEEQPSETPT